MNALLITIASCCSASARCSPAHYLSCPFCQPYCLYSLRGCPVAVLSSSAYLIYGNIHAVESTGVHCCFHNANTLLSTAGHQKLLNKVTFFIVPRLAVDGAEFTTKTGSRVRSRLWDVPPGNAPADQPDGRYDAAEAAPAAATLLPNTLYPADLSGNGWVAEMRQEAPDGFWCQDPLEPRLLVPRTPGSAPPYFDLFPEGKIHDWDGGDEFRRQEVKFEYCEALGRSCQTSQCARAASAPY